MAFLFIPSISQASGNGQNSTSFFSGEYGKLLLNSKPEHEILETALSNLLVLYREHGIEAAEKYAARHNINLKDKAVLVELTFFKGHLADEISKAQLSDFNLTVDSRSKHFIELWTPIDRLEEFALSLNNVQLVHRPHRPYETVVTQGLELIGADDLHDHGVDGEGVRIAVLDGGYEQTSNAQDRNELPDFTEMNFTNDDFESDGVHGTACAEIVYDIVPGADLYLIKFRSSGEFENVLNYLVREEIAVSSMSMGWHAPIGDYFTGNDLMSQLVDVAHADGLFFVESAGNSAKAHYRADFDDGDNEDNYHRFSQQRTVNNFGSNPNRNSPIGRGSLIAISLAWDAFPRTNQDFDLELLQLVNGDWEVVDQSNDRQNGRGIPEEKIEYVVETRGEFAVRVIRFDADNGMDFTLNTYPEDLGFYTEAGSITVPAMSANVYAVGAIDYQNWDNNINVEGFSSLGPTYDGRTKPEICAPDGVETYAYGRQNIDFYGTSASCPHAAAAAALVLSNQPWLDNLSLAEYLSGNAIDVGDRGMDNTFGWGKIHVEYSDEEAPGPPVIGIDGEDIVSGSEGIFNVNVSNEGELPLMYTVEPQYFDENGWIELMPESGRIRAGERQPVTVIINAGNLPAGQYEAFLQFLSNDLENPAVAVGVLMHTDGPPLPEMTVEPDSLSFGSVNVGERSDLTFAISNHGAGNLQISDISSANDEFTTDRRIIIIAPDSTTTVTVTFAPETGGPMNSELEISSNDPENPDFTITLEARGVGVPAIFVNPSSIDFSEVEVTQSESERITVRNTGNDDLILFNAKIQGDYFSSDFEVSVISPGRTQAINITFAPEQNGEYNGSFVLSNNDPDNEEYTIELRGSGWVNGVGDSESSGIPDEFYLSSAHPNPFNSFTTLSYGLPHPAEITIQVFDLSERAIATLADRREQAGRFSVVWDAAGVPTGSYFVRMQAAGNIKVQKVLLVK